MTDHERAEGWRGSAIPPCTARKECKGGSTSRTKRCALGQHRSLDRDVILFPEQCTNLRCHIPSKDTLWWMLPNDSSASAVTAGKAGVGPAACSCPWSTARGARREAGEAAAPYPPLPLPYAFDFPDRGEHGSDREQEQAWNGMPLRRIHLEWGGRRYGLAWGEGRVRPISLPHCPRPPPPSPALPTRIAPSRPSRARAREAAEAAGGARRHRRRPLPLRKCAVDAGLMRGRRARHCSCAHACGDRGDGPAPEPQAYIDCFLSVAQIQLRLRLDQQEFATPSNLNGAAYISTVRSPSCAHDDGRRRGGGGGGSDQGAENAPLQLLRAHAGDWEDGLDQPRRAAAAHPCVCKRSRGRTVGAASRSVKAWAGRRLARPQPSSAPPPPARICRTQL